MTISLDELEHIISHGADPGELIGFKRNGDPIFAMGGGARNVFDNWIPEEFGSDVIQRVNQVSVVEAYAASIPMGSNTKSVPRSSGIAVSFTAKGAAYNEDTSTNDQVVLTAQKITQALRVAEEDLNDSLANIIATKQIDWATSYAKFIDNACLAVTAAAGAGVPFNSVYYALTQTNAATNYTGNANITLSGTAAPSYSGLNTALTNLETSDYYDESRVIAIAHPSFRHTLRGILDSQNRPIFNDWVTSDVQVGPTLFGIPLKWSLGAKTSATAVSSPTGNPIIVFANRDLMLLGRRSGPESAFAPADSGVGFLTDESLLKMRARRAFVVGNENAFTIYVNASGL